MTDIVDFLRSAAAHPEGLAVMPHSELRDEAFRDGVLAPRGYGVVVITTLGRAVLKEPCERVMQLADDGCPHA